MGYYLNIIRINRNLFIFLKLIIMVALELLPQRMNNLLFKIKIHWILIFRESRGHLKEVIILRDIRLLSILNFSMELWLRIDSTKILKNGGSYRHKNLWMINPNWFLIEIIAVNLRKEQLKSYKRKR